MPISPHRTTVLSVGFTSISAMVTLGILVRDRPSPLDARVLRDAHIEPGSPLSGPAETLSAVGVLLAAMVLITVSLAAWRHPSTRRHLWRYPVLLAAYEVPAAETADLAREARQKGWWQNSPVPKPSQILIGLEQAATTVRQFELALVPGLLQTSDYARALMTSLAPTTPIEVLENRVAARMVRQHALTSNDPLSCRVILSEGVLLYPVGGNRVMRGQLERFLELSHSPNVAIQVVPFAAGPHPGMEGAFTIVTLPDLAHDVVYVEGPAGSVYLEEQDLVRYATMHFAMLSSLALSPSESTEFISTTLARYQ